MTDMNPEAQKLAEDAKRFALEATRCHEADAPSYRISYEEAIDRLAALAQPAPQVQEAVPPFLIAVIGREHFGNPIPKEWYSAAKELLTHAAAPASPPGWEPIETAPKDGTEVLAWRDDCGALIVSFRSVSTMPLTQEETDELDEETLFQEDWFTQWPAAERLEGNEVPTHWMPIPAAPHPPGDTNQPLEGPKG